MTIDKERLRVLIKELRTDARVDSLFGSAARNKLSERAADVLTEFEAENAALAAEVERLRKDAGHAEPMTRFCPGCGSVGEVPKKYRDCCPDGSNSRVIPEKLAKQCHDLFQGALQAAMADKGGAAS